MGSTIHDDFRHTVPSSKYRSEVYDAPNLRTRAWARQELRGLFDAKNFKGYRFHEIPGEPYLCIEFAYLDEAMEVSRCFARAGRVYVEPTSQDCPTRRFRVSVHDADLPLAVTELRKGRAGD